MVVMLPESMACTMYSSDIGSVGAATVSMYRSGMAGGVITSRTLLECSIGHVQVLGRRADMGGLNEATVCDEIATWAFSGALACACRCRALP